MTFQRLNIINQELSHESLKLDKMRCEEIHSDKLIVFVVVFLPFIEQMSSFILHLAMITLGVGLYRLLFRASSCV